MTFDIRKLQIARWARAGYVAPKSTREPLFPALVRADDLDSVLGSPDGTCSCGFVDPNHHPTCAYAPKAAAKTEPAAKLSQPAANPPTRLTTGSPRPEWYFEADAELANGHVTWLHPRIDGPHGVVSWHLTSWVCGDYAVSYVNLERTMLECERRAGITPEAPKVARPFVVGDRVRCVRGTRPVHGNYALEEGESYVVEGVQHDSVGTTFLVVDDSPQNPGGWFASRFELVAPAQPVCEAAKSARKATFGHGDKVRCVRLDADDERFGIRLGATYTVDLAAGGNVYLQGEEPLRNIAWLANQFVSVAP